MGADYAQCMLGSLGDLLSAHSCSVRGGHHLVCDPA
jgi:hypothetical protein